MMLPAISASNTAKSGPPRAICSLWVHNASFDVDEGVPRFAVGTAILAPPVRNVVSSCLWKAINLLTYHNIGDREKQVGIFRAMSSPDRANIAYCVSK